MVAEGLGTVVVQARTEEHKQNEYRKYHANLSTVTRLNRKKSYSYKSIIFNIGRRYNDGKRTGLAQHLPGVAQVGADVQANPVMVEEATARVRKISTMSAKWNRLALCGLIERLAAGLAYHTINGELTYSILSGGADVNLVAVGVTGQPAAAVEGGVFVSVAVDDDINGNTFAAILAASNGEGATLYTDHVAIDPSNNKVIAPTADLEPLAAGCWTALYRIAQIYEASHAGALFSYAFTRGLHKILTVVAHTDEGGLTRDVLRMRRFEIPHGVITMHLNQYNGLPQPYGRLTSYRRFVDSILLATAGLVSCSDPLVEHEGKRFPTTFTSTRGAYAQDAGIGVEATDEDVTELTTQISMSCDSFIHNYVGALRRLFEFTEGNEDRAELHMGVCVRSLHNRTNRHLKFKTVAPWYWIEPTGCVYGNNRETVSGAEGYGALCTPSEPGTLSMFNRAVISDTSAFGTSVYVDWRSARKHGAVIHCNLHPKDSLANMRVSQASSLAWALVGGRRKSPVLSILIRVPRH